MADKQPTFKELLDAKRKAAPAKPTPRTKGQSVIAKMMAAAKPPFGVTGPLGERGYSFQKAAAFCLGAIGADQAKEEIHAHNVLKGYYAGAPMEFGGRGFLLPFALDCVPVGYEQGTLDPDPKKVEFVSALKQKIAATTKGYDPDEAARLRQKNIGTLQDNAVGTLVPFPVLGDLVEIQRNAEVFARCGATEVPLPPQGSMALPKQTGTTTAYMVGEQQQLTGSDPATGMVNFSAKKMTLLTTINGELFKFASPTAEQLVRTDIAEVGARKMDQQQLEGTGGTQVLGLLNYPTQSAWSTGSDKVILHAASTAGANGDTFAWEDTALMQGKLPDAVGDDTTLNWVMRRLMFAYLRNRRADGTMPGDGKGPPLFNITGTVAEVRGGTRTTMENIPVVWSNTVSNSRAKGSATNLTYILLGYFKDWVTARYGVMEVLANPYGDTVFQNDQVYIRGIQRFDAAARHPASFVVCDVLVIG